eukprot:2908422-Heterocapsa_arctica.AAC.1
MDRAEWGAYEQIILMNMQTIDGDECVIDKKCIRLFYCNKSKWGDTENQYDFMHPTVQHTCKTKSYSRRSGLQQVDYKQQEGNNNTYRHRQTLIGEEHKSQ